MATYFRYPFAVSGDKTAIPIATPPDGAVSYTDGFGVNYQLDPLTDPDALDIPRNEFNQLVYDTTSAIQQYQQFGFPDFITTSDNGGTAFSYSKDAYVRYDSGGGFNIYYSLVDSNTLLPTDTTKWGVVSYGQTFVTGDTLHWMFNTIRVGGWVWLNGTTIGNAASGATGRANADTYDLFAMLWANYPNAVLPIQTSAGAASTRGVSAAADYAANKRLPTPDMRGRAFFGIDNMGGAATAGRITTAESGISGVTLGAAGGLESVQLTSNQNGTHFHTASTDSAGTHTHTGTTTNSGAHAHTIQGANGIGSSLGYVDLYTGGTSQNFVSAGRNDVTTSGAAGSNYLGTISSGDALVLSAKSSGSEHTHTFTTNSSGAHTHSVTVANSGLGSSHQNMPPAFIGGGFIMKL